MSQWQDRADIIIVGGGMVGLGMACALKDTGLHVVLIERAETPVHRSLGRDCRVSAIIRGNTRILEGLGVWQHLEEDAGPMRTMRIWDNQEAGGIRFDASEIGEDALGFLVENSVMQKAMHQVLADAENFEFCCPAQIDSVEWLDKEVKVALSDGRKLSAPLIIGADGGRSWVREQAGISCHQRDYHQKGIVATVRPERPHGGVACQRFLPTGPLAMLPMTEDLCSIVWSAEDGECERLMGMSDDEFLAALNSSFGPFFGRIQEVGKRAAFPLKAQLAKHLVRPRLALIGDAAHCIHPLAGLGVNLGLRDVMVLAQEISDARRFEEDWGELSVLNRYMKQRLPDVLSVMGSMEGFHQLFTHDFPGLRPLRGLGMRMVGNSGAIKHLLMRNSTGLSLPVPRQIG